MHARKRGGAFALTSLQPGELEQLPDVQELIQLGDELNLASSGAREQPRAAFARSQESVEMAAGG